MAKKGTSPWLYIGCGCCVLAGLVVAALIAAGIFGASVAKDYFDDLKDPESRNRRAREILGGEQLPAGYHALLFLRVPWIFEAVILTDGPPQQLGEAELEGFSPLESRHLGEHLFLYLAVRGDDEDLEGAFQGRRDSGNVHFDFGSSFASREVLTEGGFDVTGGRLTYTAHRGELTTEDGERWNGLYSEMRIACDHDGKARLALWFARDPEGAGPDAVPDLPGTPADESALRELLGHFDLCRG